MGDRGRLDWSALGAVMTGVAAVGALVFTGLSLKETRDQAALSEQAQLSERFARAVEQLGSPDSVNTRLGGIFSLERLARDSALEHPVAMEALAVFVRANTSTGACLPDRPPGADVQAALTAMGRRDPGRDRAPVDLHGACLARADLREARLGRANLVGTTLVGANLTRANLDRANLAGADLVGADLTEAKLRQANLSADAYIDWADEDFNAEAFHPDLMNPEPANLTDAYLGGADLTDAHLGNANITRTEFVYARLVDVNLDSTKGRDTAAFGGAIFD